VWPSRRQVRPCSMDLVLSMVHHPPKPRTPRPPWYSGHLLQPDAKLEQLRQITLGNTLSLTVRPSGIFEYTDNGPLSIFFNLRPVTTMTLNRVSKISSQHVLVSQLWITGDLCSLSPQPWFLDTVPYLFIQRW